MAVSLSEISVKVTADVENARRGLKSIADLQDRVGDAAKSAGAQIDTAAKKTEEAAKKTEQAANRTRSAISKMSAFREMERVGTGMERSGAALVAALGGATKVAADFDQSMRNVNSVAHLTEQGFGQLRQAVLDLARDPQIRQGPRDLAKSLYDVYSSGIQGPKALEVLRIAAKGASAGMTDTATSGRALTAVLNTGVKGVTSAQQAMDVLFKTVDQGVVTFPQLATSIGQVLPTAAKAGVSLQELAAYVVVATRSGQTAADATNDFGNVLNKIIRPSDESAKIMRKLGISYGIGALQAKGFSGVLAEIVQKTKGNQDALAHVIPDMQAYRGVLTAGKDNARAFTAAAVDMTHAMDGVGSTQTALTQQNKGAVAQWEMLKKEWELAAIEAGTTLLPTMRSIIGFLREQIEKFQSLSPETRENTIRLIAWGAAGLTAAGVLTKLITGVAELRLALSTLGLLKVASETAAVGTAAETASSGVLSLAGAFGTLRTAVLAVAAANPYAVAAAVTGAIGYVGLKAWERHSEENLRANEQPSGYPTVRTLRRLAEAKRDTGSILGGPTPTSADMTLVTSAAKDLNLAVKDTLDLGKLTAQQLNQIAGVLSARLHSLDGDRARNVAGTSPGYLQDLLSKVGEVTKVECGQAVTNVLRAHGINRTASAIAGVSPTDRDPRDSTARPIGPGRIRDRQGNPVFPQGTLAYWPGKTEAEQHFALTYLDAQGIERVVESTKAGGTRRYRSDRTLAEVQRQHGGTGRFYDISQPLPADPNGHPSGPPIFPKDFGDKGEKELKRRLQREKEMLEQARVDLIADEEKNRIAQLRLDAARRAQDARDTIKDRHKLAIVLKGITAEEARDEQGVHEEFAEKRRHEREREQKEALDALHKRRDAQEAEYDRQQKLRDLLLLQTRDQKETLRIMGAKAAAAEKEAAAVQKYDPGHATDLRVEAAQIRREMEDLQQQSAQRLASSIESIREKLLSLFKAELKPSEEQGKNGLKAYAKGLIERRKEEDKANEEEARRRKAILDTQQREAAASQHITDRLTEALSDQTAEWNRLTGRADRYQAVLAKLNLTTKGLTESQKQMVRQIAARDQLLELAHGLESVLQNAFSHISGGFKGLLKSILSGWEQLLQEMAAKYLASQLSNVLMNVLGQVLGGSIGSIFGGTGGSTAGASGGAGPVSSAGNLGQSILAGARASGGPVLGGSAYLVGEQGPELFVPQSSGAVVSHDALRTLADGRRGGDTHIHVTMHVSTPDAGSFRQSSGQIMADLARQAHFHGSRHRG